MPWWGRGETAPQPSLPRFGNDRFRAIRNATLSPGDWSMWWATEEDSNAVSSPCVRDIERSIRALDLYESYALGAFLFAVGGIGAFRRFPLPSKPIDVLVKDAGNPPVLVTAMMEKGISLRFHEETTPTSYRNALWRELADHGESLRGQAEQQRLPPDSRPHGASTVLEHWEALNRSMNRHGSELAKLGPMRVG